MPNTSKLWSDDATWLDMICWPRTLPGKKPRTFKRIKSMKKSQNNSRWVTDTFPYQCIRIKTSPTLHTEERNSGIMNNEWKVGKILGGFLPQTPSLSLTQTVTPYQFLGSCHIVLPRPESFKEGHFISMLALKWPTSKLSGRGKTML